VSCMDSHVRGGAEHAGEDQLMARNAHPGACYRCGEWVKAGDGHFERYSGGWRVQHSKCTNYHRKADAPKPEQKEQRRHA